MSEHLAREEVRSLMRRLENRPAHVEHVSNLALQLFDGLTALHGMGDRERLLLEAAGHLHDVGHKFDNIGEGHHKESARIIRQHPWQHFTPREAQIIALVARYHRKGGPAMKHEEFAAMPEPDRKIVEGLSALLRLGDSLDRAHEQFVQRVTAEILPGRIILHMETTGPVYREVLAARKKADVAQAVFQRELVFMVGEKVIDPNAPAWTW
ncbi:MAG TPA: HD domain-containing protein [Verrucomicrobiae bacterium]|jgi:exopolyphosphatase/guanosine-5'-triphosphate,3'-diphosphate pyrophosphatase